MFIAEDEIDQKEARKLMAKQLPFSRNTINNVLREKAIYGNVLGGAAPKSRLRRFDKLSDEQKEDIRKLVNSHLSMGYLLKWYSKNHSIYNKSRVLDTIQSIHFSTKSQVE